MNNYYKIYYNDNNSSSLSLIILPVGSLPTWAPFSVKSQWNHKIVHKKQTEYKMYGSACTCSHVVISSMWI